MSTPTIGAMFSGETRFTPESSPFLGVLGAPPTGTTTGPGGMTLATTASDYIRQVFSDLFGGSLMEFAEWAWEQVNSGATTDQVLYALRQTPQYKARFPGMEALKASGRPVSEAAYLDLERSYTQIARQFDLPPGFYDEPDDFGRLIGGEVSPVEWQRRLTAWQTYERETRDPTAASEIARQFAAAGLPAPSDGDFLATVIDPARGINAIERRLEAARIGTQAQRAGFGALTVDEGLTLADQGVTADQAGQGFGALAESRELFASLPGEEGADAFGRQQQLGAAFGTDQASRRRLERQGRRRAAEFSGGGSAGLGRGGLSGLGSAG